MVAPISDALVCHSGLHKRTWRWPKKHDRHQPRMGRPGQARRVMRIATISRMVHRCLTTMTACCWNRRGRRHDITRRKQAGFGVCSCLDARAVMVIRWLLDHSRNAGNGGLRWETFCAHFNLRNAPRRDRLFAIIPSRIALLFFVSPTTTAHPCTRRERSAWQPAVRWYLIIDLDIRRARGYTWSLLSRALELE